MLRFITIFCLIASSLPASSMSSSSASWQSMSPFTVTKLDSGWGANWAIRGANWRHHVRQKFVPGAPFDEAAGLPIVVTHGFSTCSDATPPKRNGLSSGAYHLPQGATLPAVVTADFSFIISESCIDAQRPHCASLELWMLEGVAPTAQNLLANETVSTTQVVVNQQPYTKASFLSDTVVWPGTVTEKPLKQDISNGTGIRRSSISFSISRPPFKLQFRDRRGACLEVVDTQLSVTSCLVGSARKVPQWQNASSEDASTSTTPEPSGTTTLPPLGMTTPSTEDLLSTLDCKCPSGYWRKSYDKCEACPPDTFAPEPHANAFCTPCPTRSASPFPGSQSCVCEEGSFRAQGEDSTQPCTTAPSAPRQLVATYFDVHSVMINWTEPEDFGGRTDIIYQVQCVAGCDEVIITRKDLKGESRMADIKTKESLETSFITIRIYSLNGVSAIAGPGYAKYFEAVLTLRSSDADAAYAHIPDRVFVLIGIFGGAGLVAAFFVVYGLMRYFRDRRHRRAGHQPIIVIASSNSDELIDEKSGHGNGKAALTSVTDLGNNDNMQQPLMTMRLNADDFDHSQNFKPGAKAGGLLIQHGGDEKQPLVQIDGDLKDSQVSPSSTVNTNLGPGGIDGQGGLSSSPSLESS